MLHTITTPDDGLITLIKDDPVRPEIPASDRVNSNSRIYVWKQNNEPAAVVCVKFLESIPAAVDDMVDLVGSATTAVFYTIWSYAAGAGRELIQQAQTSIQEEFPDISTYVTLSPKTEMARKFHLKNGARELRENSNTINYIYK
jgi:hypothetical protein